MAATKKMSELHIGAAEAARMKSAAAIVVECREAFAASAGGILGTVGEGAGILADWQHYPIGEVYDPRSHGQYFYHVHPAAQRSAGEHGHFHAFLRAEGMPAGVAPFVLPETAIADAVAPPPQAAPLKHGGRDEVSHLVAIALNTAGDPVRLFTTNRWVTGETWYRADDVIRMVDCFTSGLAGRPSLLDRWIGALTALFRPQVAALLQLRDEEIKNWRWRRRTNVFEDTRLEITSSLDIDLDRQLAFLGGFETAPRHQRTGSARLPPMAEGWGEGPAE